MNLILLGSPGTGKGTQAKILAERKGWLHVSTGDLLREEVKASSDLGRTAKHFMEEGALVPDDLVLRMLIRRIARPDARDGMVLDGFPRTLAQAVSLDLALTDEGKAIDMAVHLAVDDEELLRRLGGRWLCRSCGAIYNENSNPPKVPGRCDRCGGELYQREDDRPETVRARMQKQKPPPLMLGYYRLAGKLVEIDGTETVERVTAAVLRVIEMSKNGRFAK